MHCIVHAPVWLNIEIYRKENMCQTSANTYGDQEGNAFFYVWLPFNHLLQTKLNIQYNRKKTGTFMILDCHHMFF